MAQGEKWQRRFLVGQERIMGDIEQVLNAVKDLSRYPQDLVHML